MFKNNIKNLAKGTNNSFRQIFYGREIGNSGGPFFLEGKVTSSQ